MFRCLLWGITAVFRPKLLLIADNLCVRQQLLVLHRRNPHPRLKDADRRFWVLACRWSVDWRTSLLFLKPETVLRWHRRGWRTYWRCRSRRGGVVGRCPIAPELQTMIRRMANETAFGVSEGSKRNSPGLATKFPPEQLPSTCIDPIIGAHHRAGGHS
jgi:hypothetical protein